VTGVCSDSAHDRLCCFAPHPGGLAVPPLATHEAEDLTPDETRLLTPEDAMRWTFESAIQDVLRQMSTVSLASLALLLERGCYVIPADAERPVEQALLKCGREDAE
jgi:hypothetical protein